MAHRVLAPGDGLFYYLPMHELAARALKAGDIPAWNPFQFSGAPLLGTAQPAPFYPLELVFLALPPLLANNLYVVLNLSIAALGTYLLARKITADAFASVVGALCFVSSGFMYGHVGHQSIVATTAWLPWALHGLERVRERRTASRVAGLAAVLATALLAGQTQMFVVIVAVLIVYGSVVKVLNDPSARRAFGWASAGFALVAAVQLVTPVTPTAALATLPIYLALLGLIAITVLRLLTRDKSRGAPALLLAVGAAAGLAAVQLLPVMMILGETSRSSLSYKDATSFSFPASHLSLLLFPHLFGSWSSAHPYGGKWNLTELSAYPGAAALVFAAAGLSRARRDVRILALAATSGLALVIALGRTTALGLVVWVTPIVGQFRSWGRYAVVLDLAVAIAAAAGVASLRSSSERATATRRAVAAAGALALLALVVPLVPAVKHYAVTGGALALALATPVCAAFIAAGCALLLQRRARWPLALCALLVVGDGVATVAWGSELRKSPSSSEAHAIYSPARLPSWGRMFQAEGGISRFLYLGTRVEPVQPYLPQATDLKGIRSTNGYDPLAPNAYLLAVGLRQDGGSSQGLRLLEHPGWTLDLLRVTTVVIPATRRPLLVSSQFGSPHEAGTLIRYRYRPRLADAFLVGAAENVTRQAALRGIHGTTNFDPRRGALVEDCPSCTGLRIPGRAGAVLSERRSGGTIALDIAARRAAVLLVSEAWFPGWRASIDGQPVPTRRADGTIIGVAVPPGRHAVQLRYEAPGASAGIAVSGACLLGLGCMLVVSALRRRKRGFSAPP